MHYNKFMEALKGKQKKLDKNHNGALDAQDFKMLRKEEQEIVEATVKTQKYSWGTMKTVHHGADFSIPLHPEHHQAISKLKDEQEHKFRDETGRDWTARRKGDEVHFQGANGGSSTKVPHSTMHESADEIEFKDGDDTEQDKEDDAEDDSDLNEKAAPGFEGTVKAMKKHKEIDNPYALSWWMKNKGMKSHKKSDGTMKESTVDEAVRVYDVSKSNSGTKPTTPEDRNKAAAAVKAARANKPKDNYTGKSVTGAGSAGAGARATGNKANYIGVKEEVELDEANHREFASQGLMHPDMAKHMKAGQEMDFYHSKTGDKISGVVKHVSPTEVHIKAHKDGKMAAGDVHKFKVSSTMNEAKKEDPPFDGPYKTNFKKPNNPNRTGMDAARALAQRALQSTKKKTNEEVKLDEVAPVEASNVNAAGDTPHEEKWEHAGICMEHGKKDCHECTVKESAPVAPVPGQKWKDHAVMVNGKQRLVVNRKAAKNYPESEGWKEVAPGTKLKEDQKISYQEFAMLNEIKLADLPVRRVKGHSYGASYEDPEGADDMWDKETIKKPAAEKRGRGRPAGAQSGARKNLGNSKLHSK